MSIPAASSHEHWPSYVWTPTAPAVVGADGVRLHALSTWISEHAPVHGLLLVRSGSLIFEEYYGGWRRDAYANVNSITKSVVSALVGIALSEQAIPSLDMPMLSYFPDEAPAASPQAGEVTIRHLLSMTSGYALPPGDIGDFLDDSRSIGQMLARPVEHTPGTVWTYDDLGSHLLALILHRATTVPVAEYARQRLFTPLGIWHDEHGAAPWLRGAARADAPHPYGAKEMAPDILWSVDANGEYIGSFGLQLTLQEMAKLGYLYLRGGRWSGQQILPAAFVAESWSEHIRTPRGEGYGYLWYLTTWAGQFAACAMGFGGQLIAVFPELDLVLAMSTRVDPQARPRSWRQPLIEEFVLPALRGS